MKPPCGASGVNTMPSAPGASIGPPAASVYALDPSGVPITKPSPAKRLKSSSSTRTETLTCPAPWRTTTRSLTAVRFTSSWRTISVGSLRGSQSPASTRSSAIAELLRGHRGQRAEAPAGGAQDRAAGLRAGADGGERGPVPAQRDDQVAACRVARLGDRAFLPRGGHLDELGVVRLTPGGQCVERPVDLPPRVDDEPDTADSA